MVLIILLAPVISKPDVAHAAYVTGDGTDWVEAPSEIYWGGSAERQGVLFYVYSIDTHCMYRGGDAKPFMFVASDFDANNERWQSLVHANENVTRFGDFVNAKVITMPDFEYPATYSEDGTWVSNGGATKAYLEEELPDGKQRWEDIVRQYWSPEFVERVKKDRGKTYRICIESASGLVLYMNEGGKDYYINTHGKGYLRVWNTNKSMASLYQRYNVDIMSRTGAGSTLGTANSKWLQSIANGMIFSDPEEAKLIGVETAKGGRLTANNMYSQGYGFATIKPTIVPIHTFNGTTPSYPEEPKPDITDGECSIYKVYYTQEYDKKGRELGGYKQVYSYSKQQTTNYIVIDSERGYAVEKWLHF